MQFTNQIKSKPGYDRSVLKLLGTKSVEDSRSFHAASCVHCGVLFESELQISGYLQYVKHAILPLYDTKCLHQVCST